MRPSFLHEWDLSPDDAVLIQSNLASRVVREDQLPSDIGLVAGVDVAYEKDGDRLFAGVVVLDPITLEIVETASAQGVATFRYLPGLFSFRELPPLSKALENLKTSPDLVICDGHGIAHPRRFGLASHLGLSFDIPTIGCGKSCLIGDYSPPPPNRGDFSDLVEGGEVVGSVLRTQTDVKPLFVSIGHRISLPTARDWILRIAPHFRQPEPIRRANELVNKLRTAYLEDSRNAVGK